MPKNVSDQHLLDVLVNTLNDSKKLLKQLRTYQLGLNYMPLPVSTSGVTEALATPQNGWVYYASDLHHIRAYVNGSWVTVV